MNVLRLFTAMVFAAVLLFASYTGSDAVAPSTSSSGVYPVRPVRIIVPFPPGASDVIARMLAHKLDEKLGQPFIIDNRPGASGILGSDLASKATTNGYTLLFITPSFPVTAIFYKKLPFDPIKDFTAIGSIGSAPFMLATHPSVPVTSVAEFIALAKAKPGQLNYATGGTGSIGHLANVLFARQTGIRVTHVPYKGTGPAVTALLSGEVQFMLANVIGALSQARAGKLKALGVASARRSPLAPDLPTLTESGVSDFKEGTWYGMLAPHGVPQRIVNLLNRQIVALLETRDFHDEIGKAGLEPDISTPEQFSSFIRSEIAKWRSVMKDAGIEAE